MTKLNPEVIADGSISFAKLNANVTEEIKTQIGGSGSGIQIVESVDALDPNAAVGSIASVITPSSVREVNISELPQADATIIDQTTDFINAGNCPQVSGLQIIVPTGAISAPTTLSDTQDMLYFVSESLDLNGTSAGKALGLVLLQQDGQLSALMSMYMDVETMTQLELMLFSIENGVVTANQEAIDQINELSNGLHYIGNIDRIMIGDSMTDEVLTVYDMIVKAISGKPTLADIYVKKDSWELLHKKDLEKLTKDLEKFAKDLEAYKGEVESVFESKADKIPFTTYNSWSGLQPNVYTTYSVSTTDSVSIKLADIEDTTVYSEYILELKCTSTPSSVSFTDKNRTALDIKWSAGIAPTFEAGFTYMISIVKGFGVYSTFMNE